MKIIIRARDGASLLDLIAAAKAAHAALEWGIASKGPGHVIGVALGAEERVSFGVVRRKGAISVYPQERER